MQNTSFANQTQCKDTSPPADSSPFFLRARALIKSGFHVVPLLPNRKVPFLEDWPERATQDLDVVREWARATPNANVGIATGLRYGAVAIDVDMGGKVVRSSLIECVGAESLQKLEAEHGPLPRTRKHRSPRGGFHFLYRCDTDLLTQDPAPDIELKARGGMIVGPGSVLSPDPDVLPNGGVYEIVDDFPLQQLPSAWVNALKVWEGANAPNGVEKFVQTRLERLARVQKGNRSKSLNRTAHTLAGLIPGGQVDEAILLDGLTRAAQRNGLAGEEGHDYVSTTIGSGIASGKRRPWRWNPGVQSRAESKALVTQIAEAFDNWMPRGRGAKSAWRVGRALMSLAIARDSVVFQPTVRTLSVESGVQIATVSNALRFLERNGWLTLGGNGRGHALTVSLRLPSPVEPGAKLNTFISLSSGSIRVFNFENLGRHEAFQHGGLGTNSLLLYLLIQENQTLEEIIGATKRELGMAASTTRRLLAQLVEHGLAEKQAIYYGQLPITQEKLDRIVAHFDKHLDRRLAGRNTRRARTFETERINRYYSTDGEKVYRRAFSNENGSRVHLPNLRLVGDRIVDRDGVVVCESFNWERNRVTS